MSTLSHLFALEDCVITACPLYEATAIGPVFIAIDFYPLILGIGLVAISLYRNELYLMLLGLALSLQILLNNLISGTFVKSLARFPDCGDKYEMPSLASSHATFFVVVLLTTIFLYRPATSFLRIVLLNIFILVVIISRIYIGSNTELELLIGAVVGLVEGIVFQAFMYRFIYPRMGRILAFAPLRYLGFRASIVRPEKKSGFFKK
jgi:hypothetical protein